MQGGEDQVAADPAPDSSLGLANDRTIVSDYFGSVGKMLQLT